MLALASELVTFLLGCNKYRATSLRSTAVEHQQSLVGEAEGTDYKEIDFSADVLKTAGGTIN